jgi:imidazolonepropionase-like amidohydrolase
MTYTKKLHDAGVKLTIGTDCPSGGKAALSEMILLEEAGVPIADILQIATLNGAQAINLDDKYGTISTGKKANIVLFEKSPFKNPKNFLSEKVIIKDGILYAN